MFRWDKWLEGLGVWVGLIVIAALPSVIPDGISKAEAWQLLVLFTGGIASYCKVHPPVVE
jgi:hypothetical protein